MSYYFSDLFGDTPPGRSKGDVTQGGSPTASGSPDVQKQGPALVWVGMIVALIIMRVLWEAS
jgi:hypothetical protein